jgi:predicted transcriptional regulator
MSKRERAQGELESQVMDALWSAKDPMTSQQILDRVNESGNDLALTTILTVLSRLTDKEMVLRESAGGRSLLFSAAQSREAHNAALMLKLLGEAGNPALAFAQFTKSLTPKQLQALRKSLEK